MWHMWKTNYEKYETIRLLVCLLGLDVLMCLFWLLLFWLTRWFVVRCARRRRRRGQRRRRRQRQRRGQRQRSALVARMRSRIANKNRPKRSKQHCSMRVLLHVAHSLQPRWQQPLRKSNASQVDWPVASHVNSMYEWGMQWDFSERCFQKLLNDDYTKWQWQPPTTTTY